MSITKAQYQAQLKYKKSHRKATLHSSYKSTAKSFITKHATEDELRWLRKLIDERLNVKSY